MSNRTNVTAARLTVASSLRSFGAIFGATTAARAVAIAENDPSFAQLLGAINASPRTSGRLDLLLALVVLLAKGVQTGDVIALLRDVQNGRAKRNSAPIDPRRSLDLVRDYVVRNQLADGNSSSFENDARRLFSGVNAYVDGREVKVLRPYGTSGFSQNYRTIA